jgi:glycosyltransferase involved in cell wall biosynthesis
VGVTDRQTEILSRAAPQTPRKFFTITNGFDADDFRGEAPDRPDAGPPDASRGFVLAHVGRFDRWRASDAWMAALEKFASTMNGGKGRFTFRVVGHVASDCRRRLEATNARCECVAYVPHRQAVGEMKSADALLLNVPQGHNSDSVVPAKLFEYLAAQRPILVVGPSGGACEVVVGATASGLTASFEVDEIVGALDRLYRAWEAGTPLAGCTAARAEPFNRLRLAGTLAALLDSLVMAGECDAGFVGSPQEVYAT